ncbi:hypothetical protein PC115_g22491 [Phytophthora cactorum]|uniref:Chromo domain-containing protein n=1 Tax=Phytophthora cactorum TaxID=29920 RepID=A0A8T1AGS0_9STRA|nr:hypothetical protein PC115_g22491 [Phytophthora cactorum]
MKATFENPPCNQAATCSHLRVTPLQHVATQGIVLGVRAIADHHFDANANEWQLYVAWRGLEDAESSWDPFQAIYNDVPTLVTQYVESANSPELGALL